MSLCVVGVVGSRMGGYEAVEHSRHPATTRTDWRPYIPDRWIVPRDSNWDVDTGSDRPRIEEDDPRWDCVSMGNGICGRR